MIQIIKRIKQFKPWFFKKLQQMALFLIQTKPAITISNKVKPLIFKGLHLLNRNPFLSRVATPSRLKIFLILVCSFVMSCLVFYLMSFLISRGKNLTAQSDQELSISFLFNQNIEDLELRSRRIPKEPKQTEPPPETPKLKIETEIQKPNMISQLPQLELADDLGDNQGIGVSSGLSQNREVSPIFRINPVYPRRAALQNIEGFVILKFDITKTGSTDNISVLQARPPQIFNSSSIQALRKWRYKPKVENGKPVRQNNLKVQLDFKLTQQ